MGDQHDLLRQPARAARRPAGVAQVEQRRRLVSDQHGRLGRRAPTPARAAASARRTAGGRGGRRARRGRTRQRRRPPARATSVARRPRRAQPERDVLGHRRHDDLGVRVGEDRSRPAAARRAPAGRCPARRRARGPASAATSPLSIRANVDLPEPLAPTTPTLPSPIARSSPRRTGRSPKRWLTPLTSITAPLHQAGRRPGRRRRAHAASAVARRRPARTSRGEQPDDEHRAGRAPRVAQRDRAAVAADPLRVDAEGVACRRAPARRTPR